LKQFFDALNRKNIKDLAVIALEQQGYTEAVIELKGTSRLTEAAIKRTYDLVKHRDEVNGEDTSVIAAEEENSKACADANEAQAADDTPSSPQTMGEYIGQLEEYLSLGKKKKAKKELASLTELSEDQIKSYKKQIKAL